MDNIIKCPQCGSARFDELSAENYKCQYCGTVFSPERPKENKVVIQQVIQQQVVSKGRNKVLAGLLAIFLGIIGIHKFYLGQTIWGIIYLIFCWTYIPSLLGFIEGIIYFCMSDEKFDEKYNNQKV